MEIDFGLKKVTTLLTEELESYLTILVKALPNFVLALIVFLLFWIGARFVQSLSERLLKRLTPHKSIRHLGSSVVYLSLVILGTFVALSILQLDKAVTSLLAGAGVIGLALGFAFQDIASNFVSGVLIAFRHPYEVGDIIEAKGFMGTVTAIQLRTTTIKTFQGLEVLIPNKYLFTEPITNYTNEPERRVDVAVGVSYGDDLEKVERLLTEKLEELPNRIEGRPIEVFYNEFGASSINLEVRVWVVYRSHVSYLETRSQAVKRIKLVFDENDITIPFPIRTLDFGIKGGEKLSEMGVGARPPN